MSAPVKKCEVCDDTGSKSRDMAGYLDCFACDIADQRVKFREQMGQIGENVWGGATDALAWRAYQLGKAAASAETSTKDELIATLHRQYSELEMALAVEHAALADALRHVANLKDRLNAAPVVPVAAQPVVNVPEVLGYTSVNTPGYLRDSPYSSMRIYGKAMPDRGVTLAVYAVAPSLEAQPAGEVSAPNAALVALKEACDLIRLEVADGVHTEEYRRGMAALSAAGQEVGK